MATVSIIIMAGFGRRVDYIVRTSHADLNIRRVFPLCPSIIVLSAALSSSYIGVSYVISADAENGFKQYTW